MLNIHKATGWTSHDVVAKLRRLSSQRRVGHAGTLDPLAEGVGYLVVKTHRPFHAAPGELLRKWSMRFRYRR